MKPKYGTTQWRAHQYEQAKIARRGRNWKYDTQGVEAERLEGLGYVLHDEKVRLPSIGKEVVESLRKEGYYAKMLLVSCSVIGCPEVLIYKKKRYER